MDVLINLDVDDLARAEAFYTGLTAGRRFGAGALELCGVSSRMYLLVKAADTVATPSGARRRYDRHWTPVDAVVTRACAAGATLERAASDTAWGRIAELADPFGHGFCVLAFRGAGYDAIAT